MGNRKYPIQTGKFYHIYNRSIAHEEIFKGNYALRFLELIKYYRVQRKLSYGHGLKVGNESGNSEQIVDIVGFAIMPTHYHLLARQNKKNGIKILLHKGQTSFAKYYNKVENRHGGVFSASFKAKPIESAMHMSRVSRYIHRNPIEASIVTAAQLPTWPLTSLVYYKYPARKGNFINSEPVMKNFSTFYEYSTYVLKQDIESEGLQ